jgi:hypothetical protein
MVKRCEHCGKSVRYVEGKWFHTWWVKDPEFGSLPAGSSECAWRGRPGEVTHAEPSAEEGPPADTEGEAA